MNNITIFCHKITVRKSYNDIGLKEEERGAPASDKNHIKVGRRTNNVDGRSFAEVVASTTHRWVKKTKVNNAKTQGESCSFKSDEVARGTKSVKVITADQWKVMIQEQQEVKEKIEELSMKCRVLEEEMNKWKEGIQKQREEVGSEEEVMKGMPKKEVHEEDNVSTFKNSEEEDTIISETRMKGEDRCNDMEGDMMNNDELEEEEASNDELGDKPNSRIPQARKKK